MHGFFFGPPDGAGPAHAAIREDLRLHISNSMTVQVVQSCCINYDLGPAAGTIEDGFAWMRLNRLTDLPLRRLFNK